MDLLAIDASTANSQRSDANSLLIPPDWKRPQLLSKIIKSFSFSRLKHEEVVA
jgi:hypothetical protein